MNFMNHCSKKCKMHFQVKLQHSIDFSNATNHHFCNYYFFDSSSDKRKEDDFPCQRFLD